MGDNHRNPLACCKRLLCSGAAIRRMVIGLARPSHDLVEGLSQNIKRVRALRLTLLDVKPDIAVAMMSSACVTLAAAAWGLPGVLAIGSIRSHPAIRPTKPVWKRMELIGLGQLTAIVAQTQTTAAWLARNTSSHRIEVIPNPINWPLPEGEPRLDPDATCQRIGKYFLLRGGSFPKKDIACFSMLLPQLPENIQTGIWRSLEKDPNAQTCSRT